MNRSYLLDKEFLKELDKHHNRVIYARIIALNYNEEPIEQIEGIVTAGNISIDGKSAVRRTCSLTVMTDKLEINDVYWGFSSKVKIEIGLENTVNSFYPDLVWFPQGIYVLNNFTTSQNVNSYSISLSSKDKMCLLNGDIGGKFNAETNLGVLDEVFTDNDGNKYTITTHIKIETIIRNMIHYYGAELFSNIVINNLDTSALEMLDNRSGDTLYLIVERDENDTIVKYVDIVQQYENNTNSDASVYEPIYYYDENHETRVSFKKGDKHSFEKEENFVFDIETEIGQSNPAPTSIYNEQNTAYTVKKIEAGQAIGYRPTELTWPTDQDLIASIGETVTSILDKIVNLLGNFEYFYNLEGQFVFQKKPTYVTTSWNNLTVVEDETYVLPSALVSKVEYGFEGSDMVTVISNQPKINAIKNDFTVWGSRKSLSGIDIPIHARYAIDKKPDVYVSGELVNKKTNEVQRGKTIYIAIDNSLGLTKDNWQDENPYLLELINAEGLGLPSFVDWRELIYQMALDYYRYNYDNSESDGLIEGFEAMVRKNNIITPNGISLYPSGKTGYEQYYIDLEGFWRQLYNPEAAAMEDDQTHLSYDINDKTYVYWANGDRQYWNIEVDNEPTSLLFWFDFYEGEFSKFSVHNIGARPNVVNESNVKSIIYQNVPNILFFENTDEKKKYEDNLLNPSYYTHIILSKDKTDTIFATSTRGVSAHSKLETMMFDGTYYNASVSITSVPVYYLEPNTICYIKDERSRIDGYYVMEKITIPLSYNGTMAITAVELPQTIY